MAPAAAAGAGGGAAGTPAGGAAAAATVDEGWERVGERGDKGGERDTNATDGDQHSRSRIRNLYVDMIINMAFIRRHAYKYGVSTYKYGIYT